ncbi:hypothetical protein PspCFBP13528_21615 [Pseudomonas sp. CFBP13528]|nr:hypothetical protein PspCFBP13528_21615 [Pseudomonas sp. CFBP13528]
MEEVCLWRSTDVPAGSSEFKCACSAVQKTECDMAVGTDLLDFIPDDGFVLSSVFEGFLKVAFAIEVFGIVHEVWLSLNESIKLMGLIPSGNRWVLSERSGAPVTTPMRP